MKIRKFGFTAILIAGILTVSCSKQSMQGDDGQTPLITTRIASFSGDGQTVGEDSEVTDMQACLFQGGVMTKVYKDLPVSNGNCNLKADSNEGNLYMLANTKGIIDLDAMSGIGESEWKQTVIDMKDGKATRFFSGMIELGNRTDAAQVLTLTRGVARFDVKTDVTGSVKVKSLTLTNVAGSGYLFRQGTVQSPSAVSRQDITADFPSALEHDTPAVLYVYEQANDGIKVRAEVEFDGTVSQTLEKDLSGDLQRNHIYTVTVRKDDIDIVVTPVYEDWGTGGDTELAPLSDNLND